MLGYEEKKQPEKIKCLFFTTTPSQLSFRSCRTHTKLPATRLLRAYRCQLTQANKRRRPRFAQQMVHEKSLRCCCCCCVCVQHSRLLTCCQRSWATSELHCLTLERSGSETPPSPSFWGNALTCRHDLFKRSLSSEMRGNPRQKSETGTVEFLLMTKNNVVALVCFSPAAYRCNLFDFEAFP